MSASPPAVEETGTTAAPDFRPPNGLPEARVRPELVAPAVTRGQVISFRAGAMAGELAARRHEPEEPAARIAARCLADHFGLLRDILDGSRFTYPQAWETYHIYLGCLRRGAGREETRLAVAGGLRRPPAVAWAVLDACERLHALDTATTDGGVALWHERAAQVGLLKLPKPRTRRRAKGAES